MEAINTDKAKEYITKVLQGHHAETHAGMTFGVNQNFWAEVAESYHQQELKAKLKELRDGLPELMEGEFERMKAVRFFGDPSHEHNKRMSAQQEGSVKTLRKAEELINKMIGK